MNWRLIVALSGFGLAMALGTVSLISPDIEPLLWLAIFIVCAVAIAREAPGRYFLHGLAVSLVNSIWITAAHVSFFNRYIANHPREAAMSASMPLSSQPRLLMIIVGPVIGLVSGLVLGLFSVVAARVTRRAVSRPLAKPN